LPKRDFYLSNVLNINKEAKYLVVRRASLHGNLLALQTDLVVLGKRTVLSVEPWSFVCTVYMGGLVRGAEDEYVSGSILPVFSSYITSGQ
jgi:hypothetical protein